MSKKCTNCGTELKEKANKHYKEMEELLKEETAECVKNTTVYGGNGESVNAEQPYQKKSMKW